VSQGDSRSDNSEYKTHENVCSMKTLLYVTFQHILIGLPSGLKEKCHSEDQGVDGKMGSEWIVGRLAGGV
jgi:hypothetical protein